MEDLSDLLNNRKSQARPSEVNNQLCSSRLNQEHLCNGWVQDAC